MKFGKLMACIVATLALVACTKHNQGGGGTATANETVKITMASPPPGGKP